MTRIRVALNGTGVNPFQGYDLIHNPFPQNGNARDVGICMALQSLGGDPIPNKEHIKKILKGFSKEFVDLCCSNFRKGEYVIFTVEWDD